MVNDPQQYCENFYNALGIPAAIWQNGAPFFSMGFSVEASPWNTVAPLLLEGTELPSVSTARDSGMYGAVALNTDSVLMLGPLYAVPISDDTFHEFAAMATIPAERMQDTLDMMRGIPRYSYHQLMLLMVFLHHSLHGEQIPMEHFRVSRAGYEDVIAQQQTEEAYENEGQTHGTWAFEQRMFTMIRQGLPDRLREFLLESAKTERLTEGHLAENGLRQSKNVLIGLVSCVGKFAAIPGGMDVEETYQLIDTYTRECERLTSIEAIRNLQFNMLIDFASRVAARQLPENVSPLIYSCVQFIATRVNEPITLMDVVKHSGISRAGLCDRFKKETGYGIAEYISHCRVREAKGLLRYTDKSVAEISAYLCFSSQSYFQSVFKKEVGQTPYQYRRSRKEQK